MASESEHKGSNVPTINSTEADEVRMRPGHCLGSVLHVFFRALTLLAGWQGYQYNNILTSRNYIFFLRQKAITYHLHSFTMISSINTLTMASESEHKGSNAPTINSTVVDEVRMRPGHRLGSVLRVFFRALTLLAGWQERHQVHKNPVPLILKVSLLKQVEEENQGRTGQTRFIWKMATTTDIRSMHSILHNTAIINHVARLLHWHQLDDFYQHKPVAVVWYDNATKRNWRSWRWSCQWWTPTLQRVERWNVAQWTSDNPNSELS